MLLLRPLRLPRRVATAPNALTLHANLRILVDGEQRLVEKVGLPLTC